MPKKSAKQVEIESLVVSIPEAGIMLGVCGRTVYRLIGDGHIQSVMVGDSRKILKKEIVRYLERNSILVARAS